MNTTTKFILLFPLILASILGYSQCENVIISPSGASETCVYAEETVVWKDVSNRITQTGNNLTKIRNSSWNGDAFSINQLIDNSFMTTQITETTTNRMIGLNAVDNNNSYTDLDYAFYLRRTGRLEVWEGGTRKSRLSRLNYETGATLKIAVENGEVKYYYNDRLVYESTVAIPSLPLYVDFSIHTLGGTLSEVKISKPNSGTFTAFGTDLGTNPSYQWKLNGTNVGTNSTTYTNTSATTSDVITCEMTPDTDGCLTGVQTSNEITFSTIDYSNLSQYYITTTSLATCKNIKEKVRWENENNVIANGSYLTKVSNVGGWNAGASSKQTITNYGGYVEKIVDVLIYDITIGLNESDVSPDRNDIDYAFFLNDNGYADIFEEGAKKWEDVAPIALGDVFKILVTDQAVEYYHNDNLLYSSTRAITLPVKVDCSLREANAYLDNIYVSAGAGENFSIDGDLSKISNYQWKLNGVNVGTNSSTYSNGALSDADELTCEVTSNVMGCGTFTLDTLVAESILSDALSSFFISPDGDYPACKEVKEYVTWTMLGNNIITQGRTLEKVQVAGWAGAFTNSVVQNGGYVELVTSGSNSRGYVLGLTNDNENDSWETIDYGIRFLSDGTVRIWESGVNRGEVGTYAEGDTFRIFVLNDIVYYYGKGELIYQSTVTPTYPLYVDASLYTVGAKLEDVYVVNGIQETFTVQGTNLGNNPVYQWQLNGVDVGTNSSTYSNANLQTNDLINCIVSPDLESCTTNEFFKLSEGLTVTDKNTSTIGNVYITADVSSSGCRESIQEIVWGETTNLQVNGSQLTKFDGGTSWNNATAFSLNSVAEGGRIEYVLSDINRNKMIGLSTTNDGTSYTTLDFAFQIDDSGLLHIWENGTLRLDDIVTCTVGDTLKIIVRDNILKYYRNNDLLYTSTLTPSLPLFADASFQVEGGSLASSYIINASTGSFTANATFNLGSNPTYQWTLNGANVGTNSSSYTNNSVVDGDIINCLITPDFTGCTNAQYSSTGLTLRDVETPQATAFISSDYSEETCQFARQKVTWQQTKNVTNIDGTITKNQGGGNNWNASAFSFEYVLNGGYVSTIVNEVNRNRVIGLSTTNVNDDRLGINYAVHFKGNGQLRIYESGVTIRDNLVAYSTGDTIRIAIEDNKVKYYLNSTEIHTSATTPPAVPLYVDASLRSTNSTLGNVYVSNGISNDFYINDQNASANYRWTLNGVDVSTNTSYTNNSLAIDDEIICNITPVVSGCVGAEYAANSMIIETRDLTDEGDVYVVSDPVSDETCFEARMKVQWSDYVNVQITDDVVTKTQGDNGVWDAAVFSSYHGVKSGGYVFTVVDETNKRRAIGLSASNTGNSRNDIEYCFYLNSNRNLNVYIGGTNITRVGTYQSGDTLKVAYDNGTITFYQNNTQVYTISGASRPEMYPHASFNHVNATLSQAHVVNPTEGNFTIVPLNAGTTPSYQWTLDDANVGTNSTNYSIGTLQANDDYLIKCIVTPDFGNCNTNTSFETNTISIYDVCQYAYIWTGESDSDWTNTANWRNGTVPSSLVDIEVMNTGTHPVISSGTIQAKQFNIEPNVTITLADGVTLEVHEELSYENTIIDGKLHFVGSEEQVVMGVGTLEVKNLTFDNNAGVRIQGQVDVIERVEVAEDIVIDGGGLRLRSQLGLTALLHQQGQITGDITMERFVNRNVALGNSGLGYRYISSPFSDAVVNDLSDDINLVIPHPYSKQNGGMGRDILPENFPNFYFYDEALLTSAAVNGFDAWETPSSTTSTIEAGRGYVMRISAFKTFDLEGTPNNGNLSFPITNTAGVSSSGYNLVGNPYPSPIDWDLVYADNSAKIDATIWMRNATTEYKGNFVTYNATSGITLPSDGNYDGKIAPMQGFFIYVPTQGSTTLDFNNAQRLTEQNGTEIFYREQQQEQIIIKLVDEEGEEDEFAVFFSEKSNYRLDPTDSRFLTVGTENISTIYSLVDGQKVKINGLNHEILKQRIPLGMNLRTSGSYSLSLVENISLEGTTAYIEDVVTGEKIHVDDLKNYRFEEQEGEVNNRFNLIIISEEAAMLESAQTMIYPNPTTGDITIEVIGEEEPTTHEIVVMTLDGQEIYHNSVAQENNHLTYDISLDLPSGIYLIRVGAHVERLVINK